MNDYVHSHLIPCPACGTRFIYVERCPICTVKHSSYPHWVAMTVKNGEETIQVQIKFCSKTCAEQGVCQKLDFEWQNAGEYRSKTEIVMERSCYEVLTSRLDAFFPTMLTN